MNLSRVSLGTMLFGSLISKENSFSLLDAFHSYGGRAIDTAQMYPVPCTKNKIGLSELIIGEWIEINNVRTNLFISSKIGGKSEKVPFLNSNYNRVYSEIHLKNELEHILSRLRTNYLDVLYLHWPIRKTHNFSKGISTNPQKLYEISEPNLDENILNLINLQKTGLIKAIGLSNETPYGLIKLVEVTKKYNYQGDIFIQNPYNLIATSYIITLQEICLRERIKLQAHSPLAFGLLSQKNVGNLLDKPNIDINSRKSRYPEYFRRYDLANHNDFFQDLEKICTKTSTNIYDLAYGFLLNDPTVSHIVIGPRNIKQLETSIKSIKNFNLKDKTHIDFVYQLLEKYSILAF
ncbi:MULTISPECIES: aldo/keto reductase [Prochlorococcus]|uniref:aldo/keto reductase n=1 Tax=Prochlorococcus TaxID=1218 RepID=UPI000516C929|nr:aldo/keto reductase [Prochlorococcus marinus]KGF91729.1 aldo/keto reductase [Prochlorococcus marinus str. MIT 9107]